MSKSDNIPPFDELQRYCPRLGGQIHFHFCRTASDDREPCFKVFDCWFERFDVVDHFRQCLSEEAFQRLACSRPPAKVASLVDLIRQAQHRVGSEE